MFRGGMIRTKCFPCDRGCLAEMIPRFRFFAGTIERTRDTAVTRSGIGMIFAENFQPDRQRFVENSSAFA